MNTTQLKGGNVMKIDRLLCSNNLLIRGTTHMISFVTEQFLSCEDTEQRDFLIWKFLELHRIRDEVGCREEPHKEKGEDV
jgi:hypothetical protein